MSARTTVPRVLLASAFVLLATVGMAGAERIRPGRMPVQLAYAGQVRVYAVPKIASVATLLATARVVPRPGRLLTAGSYSVLLAEASPPSLSILGRPVGIDRLLRRNDIVELVEHADQVEDTVDHPEEVAPAPLPEVEESLWHVGRTGTAMVRNGSISGEEVTRWVIRPAPVTDKVIALTLDDGPDLIYTIAALTTFREKGVKAMFCVVGYNIRRHPEIVRQIAAEGHSLCNHTQNHDPRLPMRPQPVIDAEILGNNDVLRDVAGQPKPMFYRPPAGKIGPGIIDAAHRAGQRVLKWNDDPQDYRKPGVDPIVASIVAQARPGGVILVHDGGGDRGQTVAALPIVIDQLRAQGFTFVLPEQIAPVPEAPPPLPAPAI